MPELAEVEFFRKQWNAGIGAKVLSVELHARKRIFRDMNTRDLISSLTGARYLRSSTHGKQLLFEFSDGARLGIHLGMSGALRMETASSRSEKHDHLVLRQQKCALVFRDPRLFGRVRFHRGEDDPSWLQQSAPAINSTGFDRAFVDRFLKQHARAPIKAVLLMQRGFVGIGNWMADEILWRAGLAPALAAGKLTVAQRARLFLATRFVARESLRIIGADDSDPPRSWLIHQRWKPGGICPRHRTPLRRETIGGRTTAWCTKCQA